MSIDVRRPAKGELEQLAKGMALSFDDDPLSRWLFPSDETRLERQERLFSYMLDLGMQIGDVHTTEDLGGASIWFPDDAEFPGNYEMEMFLLFGRSYARLKILQTLAGNFEPDFPNDNLNFVGAFEPNQGIGTALISRHLAELDLSGKHATLEASSLDSRRLYERLGFVTLGEIVLPDGLTAYSMLRSPVMAETPLQ